MKTKLKLSGLLTLLIAFMAFLPGTGKAQCNYRIENRLPCSVDVKIEIFDRNPAPPPLCNTSPCYAYPDFIPAGGVIGINCGNCPNVCNIRVTVVAVAGVPVVAGSADFSTNPPGNPINKVPADCDRDGTSYIFYNAASQSFVIYP